jgi:hypothetical protein
MTVHSEHERLSKHYGHPPLQCGELSVFQVFRAPVEHWSSVDAVVSSPNLSNAETGVYQFSAVS